MAYTLKTRAILCKAKADCEDIDITITAEALGTAERGYHDIAGALAIGQLVEVQRGVEPLEAGHPLAPHPAHAERYQDAALKVELAPVIGRVVALPELPERGHLTSVIIRPEVSNPDDRNSTVTNPAWAFSAIPGVEQHGKFWYQAIREIFPLD